MNACACLWACLPASMSSISVHRQTVQHVTQQNTYTCIHTLHYVFHHIALHYIHLMYISIHYNALVHTYIHTYVRTYIEIRHPHIRSCLHSWTCRHSCPYLCVWMCVHIFICTHTYFLVHVHTYNCAGKHLTIAESEYSTSGHTSLWVNGPRNSPKGRLCLHSMNRLPQTNVGALIFRIGFWRLLIITMV